MNLMEAGCLKLISLTGCYQEQFCEDSLPQFLPEECLQ